MKRELLGLDMNHNLYHKPRGFGAYTPDAVVSLVSSIATSTPSGRYIPARPLPYQSLITRLRQAWDVLTYKADAIYWG